MSLFRKKPKYVSPPTEEVTFIPNTDTPTVKLSKLTKDARKLPVGEVYFDIVPADDFGLAAAVTYRGKIIGLLESDRGEQAIEFAHLAWLNKRVAKAIGVVRKTDDGPSVSLKIRTGRSEYNESIEFHRRVHGWRYKHEIEEAAEPWSWPWGDEFLKQLAK